MPPEGMKIPGEYLRDMEETRARLKKMAGDNGLTMVFSERIPNSRRALEATEHAETLSRGEEFHRAVFDQLYGRGRDIHDWDVLREAADRAGLDAAEMQAAVDGGAYSVVLDTKLNEAAALGIKAVPTYIIDDTYRIVGAQPYEVFRGALAELGRRTGSS